MVLDDYTNLRRFQTLDNIDISHKNDEIVRCRGKDCKLGDVRAMVSQLQMHLKNMYIFYDDIFQYTSLGLLDLVFEIKGIESPLPVKEFFNRKEFGNDFVKKICKMWGIEPKEVDAIEQKYYAEILARSPLSKNSEPFLNMRKGLMSQTFIFRYSCNGLYEIFDNLRRYYTSATGEYVRSSLKFTNGLSEKEYLNTMPSTEFGKLDYVVIQDAGAMMSFLDKNKINVGTNILTFANHNGMSDEQIDRVLSNDSGLGFGDYLVEFIKEGMAKC